MRKRKQHRSTFYNKIYAAYRDRLCQQLNKMFPVSVFIRHEIRHEDSYAVFVSFFLSLSESKI